MSGSDTNSEDNMIYNSKCIRMVKSDDENTKFRPTSSNENSLFFSFISNRYDTSSTDDDPSESISNDSSSYASENSQVQSNPIRRTVRENFLNDCLNNYSTSAHVGSQLDDLKNLFRKYNVEYSFPIDTYIQNIDWRIYPFMDGENEKPWFINKFPTYIIGRDRRFADIHIDHPTCSDIHAVLQYRKMATDNKEDECTVKLYLMDINSENGTFINGEKIEPKIFYEIFNRHDIIFGNSNKHYVFVKLEKEH